MSSSLQLLEQTHFRNEGCYKDSQNYYNSKIFNHQFLPSIEKEKKSKNVSRKKYLESTSIYGVMQDNNYDKKHNANGRERFIRHITWSHTANAHTVCRRHPPARNRTEHAPKETAACTKMKHIIIIKRI
jgi:hypothetical protein